MQFLERERMAEHKQINRFWPPQPTPYGTSGSDIAIHRREVQFGYISRVVYV